MLFFFLFIISPTTSSSCSDGPNLENQDCTNDCDCDGVLICVNSTCAAPQPYTCQKSNPREWNTGLHTMETCATFDASFDDGFYHSLFCSGHRAAKVKTETPNLYVWEVCPECGRCILQPTSYPTKSPSTSPTTSHPTRIPSFAPSTSPSTSEPTTDPTTSRPTEIPSNLPTHSPSTEEPTLLPTTDEPTLLPSKTPSHSPTTDAPTDCPSQSPTPNPTTDQPTDIPSYVPSKSPLTSAPTTTSPTNIPSCAPSTEEPTLLPSMLPTTEEPTRIPTKMPSDGPSKSPTQTPTTTEPTQIPSNLPSLTPSTEKPTKTPSHSPSLSPEMSCPSTSPATSAPTTSLPTLHPSISIPTIIPSYVPSAIPTATIPTEQPSFSPTISRPTLYPSFPSPTTAPTNQPTIFMKNLTFVGDFNVVVTNETQFLSDCSIALDPVRCIYVYSGSIIVTLTGEANIVEETITRIYDQGLIMGGYDTLFTIDSDTTSGEMQVNAAGAGGGSFSTSIIVVILIVLLLIGVACYAAWPYRDKIMGRLGLGESSDFSENQSEGAKKKVEYKKAKKIEIYEVKPQETSIVEALDHGLEQIKMAAESNCDINERSENDQSTAAILTVIRRQDPEILEFLAKNNADLDAKNVMGLAACHYAARDGLDMHLQLLIDYKANLQLKNIAGFTPLQIAQQNRRGEIVDMLQDHVVEIICDEDYSSPSSSVNKKEEDPLAFVGKTWEKRRLPEVKRQLPPFTNPQPLRKEENFPNRKVRSIY